MDEADIRRIVAESVKETLTSLGIDAANPLELQKDMQHLRGWRESIGTVKRQSLMSAIGIITAGILGAIWYQIKGV